MGNELPRVSDVDPDPVGSASFPGYGSDGGEGLTKTAQAIYYLILSIGALFTYVKKSNFRSGCLFFQNTT